MAQDFVGSNNINLLQPNGAFGTRRLGGFDAASPRYIFTQLNVLSPKIFRSEDEPILKYAVDEGEKVEPEAYAPIIPMILVNGSTGIGTGFSTTVPCFNPKDIINNLLNMIDGKPCVEMKPWYRGFKGKMEQLSEYQYETFGIYEPLSSDVVKITELPVGEWTEHYTDTFLKSVIVDDATKAKSVKFLDEYVDHCDDVNIDLTLKFNRGKLKEFIVSDEVDKKLKLKKKINTSNMHLYDPNGFIKKYSNTREIMNDYFAYRIKIYDTRKEYRVRFLKNEMLLLQNKVRFIKIRIENKPESKKKIRMNNIKNEEVIEQLEKEKFDRLAKKVKSDDDSESDDNTKSYEYLLSMQMRSLTSEKVDELEKEYEEKRKELEDYENTPAWSFWKRELIELSEAYDTWVVDSKKTGSTKNKKAKLKSKSRTRSKKK